jgi:hypothetical protein
VTICDRHTDANSVKIDWFPYATIVVTMHRWVKTRAFFNLERRVRLRRGEREVSKISDLQKSGKVNRPQGFPWRFVREFLTF